MEGMKLTLEYELHRAGWATARVLDRDRVEMAVSYLHDTVGELAASAQEVEAGCRESRVVFMDEPGEHQLLLTNERDGTYFYEVRWYDDWASWGMHSQDKFKTLLSGTVSVRRYRHQVVKILHELYKKHGPDEYQSLWVEHPFPIERYMALNGT